MERPELSVLRVVLSCPLHVRWVETTYQPAEKIRRLAELKQNKREGVVFKRLDAPYVPGLQAGGGAPFKYKFSATLSAVVAKVNSQRSVELRLLNRDGWQPAGNVTIPANHMVPAVGTVVEVRYLYAFRESGCLFQPWYLGPRTDVEHHECVTTQLKFKAEEASE